VGDYKNGREGVAPSYVRQQGELRELARFLARYGNERSSHPHGGDHGRGPGTDQAVEAVFPASLRIPLLVPPDAELAGKGADEAWPEIKAELISIRDAAGYEQGKQLAQEFIRTRRYDFSSLIKAFEDDLDASLAHLKLPFTHRKTARTTNLIERALKKRDAGQKSFPHS